MACTLRQLVRVGSSSGLPSLAKSSSGSSPRPLHVTYSYSWFSHKPDLFSQICQLAFSPTQNLLAWSDTDGNLYRWNTPIPSSHSDPVRKPLGKDGILKEAKEDKDAMDGVGEEDYGDDVNLEDDEWIIDDLNGQGGFTEDKKVGFAREMGECQ